MQITHQEAFDQRRESKTWCSRRRIGHQGPPLLPYNPVGPDSPYEATDCPNQGHGIDTINFRNVKESESVDISGARAMNVTGVPLDSGLATPGNEAADPFLEFNSVTLHHDDDVQFHDISYASSPAS